MNAEIIKPTIQEIRAGWQEDNEDIVEVYEEADPSWRHGCYMHTVFRRISDDTFWAVNWQKNGDGEYNSLRDGECSDSDVTRVWPHEVVTTEYKAIPPEG